MDNYITNIPRGPVITGGSGAWISRNTISMPQYGIGTAHVDRFHTISNNGERATNILFANNVCTIRNVAAYHNVFAHRGRGMTVVPADRVESGCKVSPASGITPIGPLPSGGGKEKGMTRFAGTCALAAAMQAVAATGAEAVDHYIREGAAGLPPCTAGWGDDQACPSLPAVLQRGDTYYVADGNYGGYTFDDPPVGTQTITVKKAVPGDHGTDAGWQDSYGDGAAIFAGKFLITTSYWVIDGAVGSGNGGHGFKIDMTAVTGPNMAIKSYGSYITLRHIHIHWPDNRSETYMSACCTSGGIEFYHTDGVAPTDVKIQYCYLEKTPGYPFRFVGTNNLLLEDSYVFRMHSDALRHASGLIVRDLSSSGGVIRNNIFIQTEGSYSIGFYNSGSPTYYDDWHIYGNVFVWEEGPGAPSHIIAYNYDPNIFVSNLYIYNNVFFDGRASAATPGKIVFGGGSNKYVYNNIFYGMQYHIFGGVTYDYNYYSNCGAPFAFSPGAHENPWSTEGGTNHSLVTSDPFFNSAGMDFSLAGPLPGYPGLPLSDPYDPVDPRGITRGTDGVWDRGAYEFVGHRPQAPANLRVE